ncbi:hemolysin family protein [Chloroflexota bacterium]
MSSIDTLYVVFLVVCLILSAFFSSSETAFISLQRIKVEHLVNTRVKGAERVARMIQRPDRLLSIILLGTNFVNAAAVALATALAISFWRDEQQAVLGATIAMTVILLVFAETTPKTIAAHHAERLSLVYSRPLELFSWLLMPLVVLLSWIASGLSKLVGGAPVVRSLVGEEEIRTMISMGHREGSVEEAEANMLHNVFEFGDRPVREVMVPRPEVICIEQGSTIADFLALYAQSPQSRYPVYQENMDNVIGILSIKDVLMAQAKDSIDKESVIDELVRPAYFTPETKRINELFVEMRDRNYQMSVVVDEFGGTAGIVSLNRLVEEIVGPVGDELGAVEEEYAVIDERTFQIDGGMRIEEANEEMGLGLPEGDYETVAGFILDLLGYIPRTGERLKYRDMNLTITEMRGVKIEEIQLTRESHAAPED